MQVYCQMPSTCTPKLEGTSMVLGQRDISLHLPSPGAKQKKIFTQSLAIELNNIKQLHNEINRLYNQRLSFLELNNNATSEELLQKKVNFLQSYVNDLTEQNQMLVQTIEDLQMEDECKGSNSEVELCMSDHVVDMSEVVLRSLLLDELAGPVVPIMCNNGSVVQMGSESEDLKILVQTKNKINPALERKLAGRFHQMQKIQTSECMLSNISETPAQTRTSQNTASLQRHKIQNQLCKASKEVERLQQELTRVRHSTEKKLQRRERKMCVLLKELTERKKQHSDCQKELLRRKESLAKLHEERDELRAKTEDRSRECVHLNQTKEKLEAELALSREKLHTFHLEVRSRDQFIIQLRSEMKTDELKHQDTQKKVTALEEEVRHLNCKVRTHEEKAYQLSKKVKCLKNQKDEEKQQLHNQLCISQQQVEAFGKKVKKQETEMDLLCQQLKRVNEQNNELKEAILKDKEQKETIAILKQKYTTSIEKLHKVQGQVELLKEELRYSQQKLKESQLATQLVKEDFAELERRYQEKVCQWERSQEAFDQLTDELQANQNELTESQEKVSHFKSLVGSLQEQMDTLKQQKLMVECDLCFYQQSHSHSDEDYLSLSRLKEQLQKCCTEQVERLAECEKAILQMKSELARQTQEKENLKQLLAASQHTHLNNHSQPGQEVTHLKKEVMSLEVQLAATQKVHVMILKRAEEQLKEAKQESMRRSKEVDIQRVEVQRLQDKLKSEEEKMRCAIIENESLSTHTKQLRKELDQLCSKHQVAVEELAARAGEARRMEGCLNEGKLAEEKMRSVAARLEKEVVELRGNLQQAVDHKLKAEREKEAAQELVNIVRSDLEKTQSDNSNLRYESQLVMKNVNLWITEQKASSESLAVQMKAQDKLLLIITEEKEQLQVANDTLKAEVKRLTEVADEKARDTERFKAQIGDRGILQYGKTAEKKSCVARNLNKIEDMHSRLQSNLEAIGVLNQQINVVCRENKWLRRQLEEERSMQGQVQRQISLPSTFQHRSSIQLPLSLNTHHPTISTSSPSSHDLPHLPSFGPVAGDGWGCKTG